MNRQEILSHIDHTLLKAFSTWEDIQLLCDEALKYKTASVCISQTYVKRVRKKYGEDINICTVVGFPLGYNSTGSKIKEVEDAISNGANEIDMVVNISDVKNKDYNKVEEEIRELKNICGEKILKVIIESCYLDEKEKIAMCKAITNAKADYIKTSTGFGSSGATMEDIILFKKNIGRDVKIKAAGGVKSIEDLIDFLNAGCDRIGTSSAVKMLVL
ncbi:MAG: deoxyribose-phosphate aldolase [Peptostreptococcus sp.]|uniref:deoxyribose-phosphate aldolase n=1 Tax=Peptostreptococcus sp. TaxID=1262 RepID=UPI002FC7A357